jgi:hypothetical protein
MSALREVVTKFFPNTIGYAQVIGDMGANSLVPPPFFVRLVWAKTHPGEKFTNSEYQQLEIIDIYLQNPPLDWHEDPYITVMLPTSEPGSTGP